MDIDIEYFAELDASKFNPLSGQDSGLGVAVAVYTDAGKLDLKPNPYIVLKYSEFSISDFLAVE